MTLDSLNPFANRTMVLEPDEFFGRADELRDLYQRILRRQSVSLVGERRVGKSSLLNALRFQRTRPEYDIPDAIKFVYFDMQFVSGDEQSVIERLLDLIEDETGVREGSGRRRDIEPTLKTIQRRSMALVLLLDEFNLLTENPNVPSTFYDLLRAIAGAFPVSYVTAYREGTVDALVAGLREYGGLSPFMNIFGVVYVGPLKAEDADALVLDLAMDAGIEFSAEEVGRIQEIGGQLPFFLQIAAYHAFEAKRRGGRIPWAQVEAAFRVESEHHLQFLWSRLPVAEQTLLRAICARAASAWNDLQHDRAFMELKKKGLLIETPDGARLFSSVFRQLIEGVAV